MTNRHAACCLGCCWLALTACGGSNAEAGKPTKEEPAKVDTRRIGESELTTIQLTEKAHARLGIQTVPVDYKPAPKSYAVAGEVIVPPGQTVQVSAPLAGSLKAEEGLPSVGSRIGDGQTLFRIDPLLSVARNLRPDAEAELKAADARLEAAKARLERASRLLRDRVGSERAVEDAQEAERVAATLREAAEAKLEQIVSTPLQSDVDVVVASPVAGVLRQLHVGHGQIVAQGAPLFEVAKLDPLWVRVPVYSGDMALLKQGSNATVRALNASPTAKGRMARPVQAPPSADPRASTSDLFFQLDNSEHRLRPGERVSVSIPMRGEGECLQAPWKSILYDIHGGAWVYKQVEPLVYTRQRVIVTRVSGDIACLAEEVAPGIEVVTDGAAELFGTEFGGGK